MNGFHIATALMRRIRFDRCQRAFVAPTLTESGRVITDDGYRDDEESVECQRTLLDALDRFVSGRARRCA